MRGPLEDAPEGGAPSPECPLARPPGTLRRSQPAVNESGCTDCRQGSTLGSDVGPDAELAARTSLREERFPLRVRSSALAGGLT